MIGHSSNGPDVGTVIEVIHYGMWAWNDTSLAKERLLIGDLFLVISNEGYTRAVRLRDTCIFNFSHSGFSIYTKTLLEDD